MENVFRVKFKKRILFIVCLLPFYCNCQIVDTISCKINIKEYETVIKSNIIERSIYTKKNENKIQALYENDSVKLLTEYKFDSSYVVTSIPVFKLNKNIINNQKINILKKINFSNDFQNQFFNIYFKDKIVFESRYINQDSLNFNALINNSLTLDSFDDPTRIGHLKGYLLKLRLEKDFFAFFINDCPIDHMFVVDNGIVYAIFNPTPEGDYYKLEINEYFHKYYDKEFIYHKKPSSCKKYKKKYFFKVLKD